MMWLIKYSQVVFIYDESVRIVNIVNLKIYKVKSYNLMDLIYKWTRILCSEWLLDRIDISSSMNV
jgi:hypothetical protein